MEHAMNTRIDPAVQPYEKDMEETLARLMPEGVEPLVLFRTLARNSRVFRRFMAGGLLDKGTLTLRQREIIIDRACALCRGEYEWGVHVAFFAEKVGFGAEEIAATVAADGASASCWSGEEKLIMELVDELHRTQTLSDGLWARLKEAFTDEQMIEMVVLAGLYHMVSFVVNGLKLPLETYAARFPESA
jgi:alkylhydroperoxidase family enzyme